MEEAFSRNGWGTHRPHMECPRDSVHCRGSQHLTGRLPEFRNVFNVIVNWLLSHTATMSQNMGVDKSDFVLYHPPLMEDMRCGVESLQSRGNNERSGKMNTLNWSKQLNSAIAAETQRVLGQHAPANSEDRPAAIGKFGGYASD